MRNIRQKITSDAGLIAKNPLRRAESSNHRRGIELWHNEGEGLFDAFNMINFHIIQVDLDSFADQCMASLHNG